MTQLSLPFSALAAQSNRQDFSQEEEKEMAIERSGEHAEPSWKRKALEIVMDLCTKRREFTSDEVWAELSRHEEHTKEPRALGAIMRQAAKMGICRAIGYAKSERRERHSGVVSVWRSNLS